jgi:hypothetical protein
MMNWTACTISIVIGAVGGLVADFVLYLFGIDLGNLCHRSTKCANRPIITHKCSVCGKNYWTRGENQP